jgi:hypothetical protein
VTVTGAMGTHIDENGPLFAQAVASSTIVAVEGPGVKDRAGLESVLTRLISSEYNTTKRGAVDATLAQLAESGYDGTEIFAALRGSDKTVVILDLDANHPDYPKVEADKAAREQYATSLTNLDKVEITRDALSRSLTAAVEAHSVRDSAMKQQIGSLISNSEQQDPPPGIGVIVGSLHSDVVTSIGDPVDPVLSAKAQREVEANYSLYDQALMAKKAGDHEAANALIERILLSGYALQAFLPADSAYLPRQADDFTQEFDDSEVSRIMGLIDQRLQYQMFDLARRKQDIGGPLAALQGMAANRQRMKRHKQYYHPQSH